MKLSTHHAPPATTAEAPAAYIERARAEVLRHHAPVSSVQQQNNNQVFSEPIETASAPLFQGQPNLHNASHQPIQSPFSIEQMHRVHSVHGAPSRSTQPQFAARHTEATAQGANTSATSIINSAQQDHTSQHHVTHHKPQHQSHLQPLQHQTQNNQSQQHGEQGHQLYVNNHQQPQYNQYAHRFSNPKVEHPPISTAKFLHPHMSSTRFEPQQLPNKFEGPLHAPHISQYQPPMRNFASLSGRPSASSVLQGLAGNSRSNSGGDGMSFVPSLFDPNSVPMNGIGGDDAIAHTQLGPSGMDQITEHQGGVNGTLFGTQGLGAVHGEFNPESPLRRLGQARRPRPRTRLNQLTEKEKKERHNAHTRSSRLRIDGGLQKLKGALRKARPNLKLNKKADIVDEATKFVLETYRTLQMNNAGELQDSSLSG